MSDRYDELVQIRQQAAHQRMLQGLENQRQANWSDYCQALSENDVDKAAWAEAEYLKNTKDLAELSGHQQQQQAQQFTDAERDLMRDYPQIVNDPQKWNTALAASRNLQLRGYDRNSGEYAAGIAHACGITDANGAESLEVASPDEALRACQSKYGSISVDEYNQNVQRLHEMKKLGYYKPGQT